MAGIQRTFYRPPESRSDERDGPVRDEEARYVENPLRIPWTYLQTHARGFESCNYKEIPGAGGRVRSRITRGQNRVRTFRSCFSFLSDIFEKDMLGARAIRCSQELSCNLLCCLE